MKSLLLPAVVFAITVSMTGCATVEQQLLSSNAVLLSSKDIREVFQNNTVSTTSGESFFCDLAGVITGQGSYGGILKGNWKITDDGRICTANWNSSTVPTGCFKVYYDAAAQQRKMVDVRGNLKYIIKDVVEGNPNNF